MAGRAVLFDLFTIQLWLVTGPFEIVFWNMLIQPIRETFFLASCIALQQPRLLLGYAHALSMSNAVFWVRIAQALIFPIRPSFLLCKVMVPLIPFFLPFSLLFCDFGA